MKKIGFFLAVFLTFTPAIAQKTGANERIKQSNNPTKPPKQEEKNTLPEEIKISKTTCQRYNEIWKKFYVQDLNIVYASGVTTGQFKVPEIWRIEFNYLTDWKTIYLDDAKRKGLIEIIEKYSEWNKKASTKGDKLDKEIGRIEGLQPLKVLFSSSTPKIHKMIFVGYDFVLYFSSKDAMALLNSITDTALIKAKAKNEKKKALESEYK